MGVIAAGVCRAEERERERERAMEEVWAVSECHAAVIKDDRFAVSGVRLYFPTLIPETPACLFSLIWSCCSHVHTHLQPRVTNVKHNTRKMRLHHHVCTLTNSGLFLLFSDLGEWKSAHQGGKTRPPWHRDVPLPALDCRRRTGVRHNRQIPVNSASFRLGPQTHNMTSTWLLSLAAWLQSPAVHPQTTRVRTCIRHKIPTGARSFKMLPSTFISIKLFAW